MAILFADDFKGYGTTSALMLNGLWGAFDPQYVTIANDPDPASPAGTKVLHIASNTTGARRPFLKGSVSVCGCAVRLWMATLPAFRGIIMAVLSADNSFRLNVGVLGNGAMVVSNYRPGNGQPTIIGQTPGPVLTANAFHHIEVKFIMGTGAGATGGISIRVDGVPVLTLANIDAGAATAEQIQLGNGEGAFDAYYKDFVVWDNSGTQNNDFLGTVFVVSMVPDGDVDLEWTPSTGTTGFNLLDNSPPLDTTQYISAGYPPPPPSTFSLSDLPVNVTSVKGLISQVRARKADGGDGNIQASLISSGDTVNGASRPITTAFTYYEDVFEIDPHTGVRWTPASADAAQFKINRTV